MRCDSRQIFLDVSHKRSYSLEFMFGYDSVVETSNQSWRQISFINSASCRSSPSHFSRALQLSATLREYNVFRDHRRFQELQELHGEIRLNSFYHIFEISSAEDLETQNLLTRSISKQIQELFWQDRRAHICQSVQETDTICIDRSCPIRVVYRTNRSRESDVDDYSDSIQAL